MALIQGLEESGKPLLLKRQGLKGDNANSLHRLIFPAIKQLNVFLALRRVDKRPGAVSILEGDLIAALERQGLACIGRCRDFQAQTFDNLPRAMHLSSVAGCQFASSDP
jgi:hypothetical protein